MPNQDVVLAMQDIKKVFPGVVALSGVTMDFRKGEIHAIAGENGAGKSTFIKVITGAHQPDGGTIVLDGEEFDALTPNQSRQAGIEAIYQEYNLIEGLSAAENICFGKRYGRLVNFKKMNEVATELFDRFKVDIDPNALVRDLSSGKCQIIEIAKAVSKNARILIMDEPTAPLSVAEVDVLMDVIQDLKRNGVTIIYISHRLDEIFQIADRVSVLRDGQYICTKNVADITKQELITYMVGRELSSDFPRHKNEPGEVALELRNLGGNGVKDVSFTARRGEIVGLAGMVGAGRSEIMRVIYGEEKKQRGSILVNGKEVDIRSTTEALTLGLGLVPEDRKREGVFLPYDIQWNTAFATIKKLCRFGFINAKKEKELAESYRQRLKIKASDLNQVTMTLSGGNQQKVVVAKTLAAGSDILIFDEPTRGIDVGAKREIYELMTDLCEQGKCIIMVTSDMEELIGMSDRIEVFCEKRYVGELTDRSQFSQERILLMASGEAGEEINSEGANAS